MALTERQQVIEQLRKSKNPLICFPKTWNPDAVASAIALFDILDSMGKKTEMFCEGFSSKSHISFLNHLEKIRPEISPLRKFVISVDTKRNKVGELSYEADGDALHIYLSPKSGHFDASHVRTKATDYHHDLIITIDTPDLRSLGKSPEDASDFFHHTPILNIDHSPANEHFGQVNHVDVTASSNGEVIYLLAKEMDHPITKSLATSLLTGIVSKTKSFKKGSITPRLLSLASELIAQGAERDRIVTSLYRTKDISTLKLWGRALARMKHDQTHHIVSTVLTRQDFALSGASEHVLADVIDELISASPEAETVALLYELENKGIRCIVRNEKRKNADALTSRWKGRGGRVQSVCTLRETDIMRAERDILDHLKATLSAV